MPSLKDLKNRIGSVKSTQKITSAMKMVAAAKLRTSQSNMEQCRPYSNRISMLLNDLLLECDNSNFDLMKILDKYIIKKYLGIKIIHFTTNQV